MSWDKDHYTYTCSDGEHNSFWRTVRESPQWEAWDNYNHGENTIFDVMECGECGWISQKHFQAFLKFCSTLKVGCKGDEPREDDCWHYANVDCACVCHSAK